MSRHINIDVVSRSIRSRRRFSNGEFRDAATARASTLIETSPRAAVLRNGVSSVRHGYEEQSKHRNRFVALFSVDPHAWLHGRHVTVVSEGARRRRHRRHLPWRKNSVTAGMGLLFIVAGVVLMTMPSRKPSVRTIM
ncbi:hypothetical protein LZC95_43235 [Pendulispora brunnea]|uniref:Uncharacterized protein n=1 Tax=Pendulispora brunnea TaxID=2905690 RepID=A0ABZ2K3G4_9BACT